jgi:hypothetical protein
MLLSEAGSIRRRVLLARAWTQHQGPRVFEAFRGVVVLVSYFGL